MARAVRNSKLDTRSARAKLAERREPYWAVISTGCAIGYRRGKNGGTWVARYRSPTGGQVYESLGAADDARDADGLTVFAFNQAQDFARDYFKRKAREFAGDAAPSDGPYTVARAIEEYLQDREQSGSKGARKDRYTAASRIVPEIGDIEVRKLTASRIKTWRHKVETGPKLRRTAKAAAAPKTAKIDLTDEDVVRARRATSNRTLTILKAALNFAFAAGKVPTDEAWRQVKPHREVDTALIRFLKPDECVRLVNAAGPDFRSLVRGALVTGARYGELSRMKVEDFSPHAGNITVRRSKGSKRRHIALTAEGLRLFNDLTAGRLGAKLIFLRGDGDPWGPSHQQRPIEEASARASIDPPATFHILRHTYASALAMKGVSMRVIADQLGHVDTRITEKHYAHLAPSHVADVVRAALPDLGIVPESNIETLEGRTTA